MSEAKADTKSEESTSKDIMGNDEVIPHLDQFEDYLQKTAEDCAQELGFILYDWEYWVSKQELKCAIMNPETGSATIENCTDYSHLLQKMFEERPNLLEELAIEVSSPGINRKLTKRQH